MDMDYAASCILCKSSPAINYMCRCDYSFYLCITCLQRGRNCKNCDAYSRGIYAKNVFGGIFINNIGRVYLCNDYHEQALMYKKKLEMPKDLTVEDNCKKISMPSFTSHKSEYLCGILIYKNHTDDVRLITQSLNGPREFSPAPSDILTYDIVDAFDSVSHSLLPENVLEYNRRPIRLLYPTGGYLTIHPKRGLRQSFDSFYPFECILKTIEGIDIYEVDRIATHPGYGIKALSALWALGLQCRRKIPVIPESDEARNERIARYTRDA